ncbi:hypothetical protein C7U89_18080 [Bradyrhizobium sp. WBOS4]|nr:hypothetical protein [Bradyrhizobium sp. WBOS8]MDD1584834.1 hypothetical protein [Bradyrhizobium sp. WBOS4]
MARARNPFPRVACCTMDSGLALRAPRNDGGLVPRTRERRPHRPVQTGFLFSLNALRPSLASSVIASSAIWLSV